MLLHKAVRFGLTVTLLFAAIARTYAFTYHETRREIFLRELEKIDFHAVKKDIIELMHSSQPFHPSDYHHYGPFFIRMAWHCAGTYRQSDGEGGCDGGRQRFAPEADWEDNANLLKARQLLWPIKQKYGFGLSWGDLFTLTGTLAIQDMNGPMLGWCGGRIDDTDGEFARVLGPSWEQEHMDNCKERGENGDCKEPLGQNTIGLIYVNPEGFMGKPNPEKSAEPTRDVFGRMGMNDTETVALIAGGHSFGKAHGDPKTVNTAGIEGPWTATPLEFNTDFINLLLQHSFDKYKSPAGKYQWRPHKKLSEKLFGTSDSKHKNEDNQTVSTVAPSADLKGTQEIMMMTTDVALTFDEKYKELLIKFRDDKEYFTRLFGYSWYKLMTRDMGAASRCFGPFTAEPQDFQGPLPEPVNNDFKLSVSFDTVESKVSELLAESEENVGSLSELAYLCAATFRESDHNGGCNGARVRLSPERDWPERKPLIKFLDRLERIKAELDNKVSLSDLIVLAGTVALNKKGLLVDETKLEFCSGRVDAETAPTSEKLRLWKYNDKVFEFKRQARLFDISVPQLVALMGRPRSTEYYASLEYSGTYSNTSNSFSNEYFKLLISQNWTKVESKDKHQNLTFGAEFSNEDGTRFMTEMDIVLKDSDELLASVFEFAGSEALFERTFVETWTQLMNSDRYDGPVENLCSNGKAGLYQINKTVKASADTKERGGETVLEKLKRAVVGEGKAEL